MREALQATIEYVFDVMRLHRVQANYVPENRRSAALLEHLGFVREGLARDYLFINGAWRDHVLTARLNPAFDASVFTPRPYRPA
jgi:ribosomal-protein-alanine N-acetyltransferase